MACARCRSEVDVRPGANGWCAACEQAYDAWVRRYASDIIPPVLAAMLIVAAVGLGLPLLGLSWLFATTGVFAGFGTLYGTHRLLRRKRRREFLIAPLPRAYLPGKS